MHNKKYFSMSVLGLFAFIAPLLLIAPAHAGAAADISDVAQNVTLSAERLPGLISGVSYLLALLFGVTGILKLREHVENPNQTPLRTPLIRFIAGGGLLALPIVLEAATRTIGNPALTFGFSAAMDAFTSTLGGVITSATGAGVGGGINDLMANIIASISGLPGIVTAISYLMGLLACVTGILKIKDHVENPDRVELKEGVIRLLLGGALFAIPTIFQAVQTTITGTGASIGLAVDSVAPVAATYLQSVYADDTAQTCAQILGANGDGLGASICRFVGRTGATPAFLTSLCYLFGIVIGVWALLKIRDHVLNPQQTPVWEGVSRLIVAGAFLAMPYLAGVFQAALTDGTAFAAAGPNMHTGWIAVACGTGPRALDTAMACFMNDVMAPAHVLFGHFAFIAGLVFIMIGITRLMKSAQEGARGPGGKGTLATFIIAGILLSYNVVLDFFTASISSTGNTNTTVALTYTTGMTAAEVEHANIIVQTILQFMIIVGLVSFIRGWFIIRDVAEGNQQASMMAGATHIIGGALAINLGPILNSVQSTLGITGVGIGFS